MDSPHCRYICLGVIQGTNGYIGEYQLSKLFPKDFKSSMPTIEELEKGLKDNQK